MLFSLFSSLIDSFSFFNVFKYLTVRTGLSMFTAMIIVIIIVIVIEFFGQASKKNIPPEKNKVLLKNR